MNFPQSQSTEDQPKGYYHNIAVLVTVPHDNQIVENTLTLETLRVGFPNASVHVYSNNNTAKANNVIDKLCQEHDYRVRHYHDKRMHHAKWIRNMVEINVGELTILDPDIIFYADCEDFDFPTSIAGRFVPVIWNEFAGAISYERLHTSFLMIKNCIELRQRIVSAYPFATSDTGQYSPVDPFMPSVKFHQGFPMFWDTCSMLFHMVGGSCFTEHHLKRYSHVNCCAFQEVMEERVEDKEAFKLQHQKAREKDFEWFKDFWMAEEKYYAAMHQKAQQLVTLRHEVKQNIRKENN